ncbi:glycosyltransferase family 39 protein [Marinirhabdus gelatinilytica]|uniref:Dolichyl-phosphate-mannose-protein mannosyltransferase n=1 Tax=Marinirhabdus gelatinilytica TaxID=1703343 RepID=A0A370QJJ8_9FLAO|nr:glycosyltransferase family 39 protein [Marinirhabdus gelatinilytica]RDK88509.1 dolichyl-phosphate-mannose-protein mannosyltransferase [Marinirhabdus gelatinilytica]
MFKNIKVTHSFKVYLGLIVAFFLRIFNLNYEGLWNDELFTAFSASNRQSLGFTIKTVAADVHPPLHNILTKLWTINFGFNDTSLRMFNVMLGVLGVLSVYHLAKLLFNKKTAVFALWLAVLNSFLILYSQEVRSYMLLFVLANYSYYYFVRLLDNPNKTSNLVYYVLFSAAALYTHYFALFITISQGVTLLILMDYSKLKNSWKSYLLMFLGPILLFVPWMPIFLKHLQYPFSYINEAKMHMLYRFPQEFFNDKLIGLLVLVIISLLLIYFVLRKFSKSTRFTAYFTSSHKSLAILFLWIVVYFSIPFVKSYLSDNNSNMNHRYFIAIVGPMVLLLAFSIAKIKSQKIRTGIFIGIIVYSTIILATSEKPYFEKKGMYREIVQSADVDNGTPILFLTSKARNFDYYLRQNGYRQLRARQKDFDVYMNENDPEEYVVFIDLHHKIYQLDKILKEKQIEYEGYSLFEMKEARNMHKATTMRMLHYKKSNDSL